MPMRPLVVRSVWKKTSLIAIALFPLSLESLSYAATKSYPNGRVGAVARSSSRLVRPYTSQGTYHPAYVGRYPQAAYRWNAGSIRFTPAITILRSFAVFWTVRSQLLYNIYYEDQNNDYNVAALTDQLQQDNAELQGEIGVIHQKIADVENEQAAVSDNIQSLSAALEPERQKASAQLAAVNSTINKTNERIKNLNPNATNYNQILARINSQKTELLQFQSELQAIVSING